MKTLLELPFLVGASAFAEDQEVSLKELRAQQRALRLATAPGPEADREIARRFDELDASRLPLARWLEAAAKRGNPALPRPLGRAQPGGARLGGSDPAVARVPRRRRRDAGVGFA